MKIIFCDYENKGVRIGVAPQGSTMVPLPESRLVFENEKGVKKIATVSHSTYNYTTTYDGTREDTVFVSLYCIMDYADHIEEKRREFRASLGA